MGQDAATLLGAYDEHLRGPVELAGATDVATDGPLCRGRFSDTGFVTNRPLAPGADLPALVARTIAHFAATDVVEFEWKTRGHDLPGLAPLLRAHGLVPGPEETLMVGPVDLALGESAGPVTVRRAGADGDTTLWLAEADGVLVGTGRLEVVPGTPFAGLWGGAVDPAWRHRGVYRALTAARARYARAHGVRLLHSDCLPTSRPILERAGLVAVGTTTPWVWRR